MKNSDMDAFECSSVSYILFDMIDVLNTINAETDFPNDKTQNKEVHFFMFQLLKMQKTTVFF